MTKSQPVVAFIGGGNMTSAIVGGQVANGHPPDAIIVSEPDPEKAAALAKQFGIRTTQSTEDAVSPATVVVLSVKPQVIPVVAQEIAAIPGAGEKLFISIAAGITLSVMERILGDHTAIIRAMPNTPALIGLGATAFYANRMVSRDQIAVATRIMESFGVAVAVAEEVQLDAVTALSGSGPAYFFLMLEEMIRAGTRLGLPADVASRLAKQTALGAAGMARSDENTPEELRRRVTSPNGTTEAAIRTLQHEHFGDLIERAMVSARDRAVELGESFGSAD